MAKYAGYCQVYSGFQGAGRPIFVKEDIKENFDNLVKSHQGNYFKTSIFRQVVSLNADPIRGRRLNPVGDLRRLTCGNISMSYYLFNGAVLIQSLIVGSVLSSQKFALVNVAYSNIRREWESQGKKPRSDIDSRAKWKSKDGMAHYAAVGGKFGSVHDAGRHIAEHVIKAYQKADYLTSSDAKDPFSLFWIKNGMHKKTETAQSLASIMQQSATQNKPVNWLIHGEGAQTFKKVAEILKSTPLATASQRQANPGAGKIHSQNVYFSNPSISSEKQLKQLCTDGGLNFVGLNQNNRDMFQFSTLKNVTIELSKVVAVTYGASQSLSLADSLKPFGAGGADKLISNGVDSFISGNYFGAAVCAVAGGFIAIGVAKKSQSIRAGIKCTFGKGNKYWYTSDKELLQA